MPQNSLPQVTPNIVLITLLRTQTRHRNVVSFLIFPGDHLGRLLPNSPEAEERADGSRQTDEAIVESDVSKSGQRNRQIAKVGDELNLGSITLTVRKKSQLRRLMKSR